MRSFYLLIYLFIFSRFELHCVSLSFHKFAFNYLRDEFSLPIVENEYFVNTLKKELISFETFRMHL